VRRAAQPGMAEADAVHQFNKISLGSKGGVSEGQLKITQAGFWWRSASGGKTVEIRKDGKWDLVTWMAVGPGELGCEAAAGLLSCTMHEHNKLLYYCTPLIRKATKCKALGK